jgi:hypothetical protein
MSVDSLEFGDCAVVSRPNLFPAASVVLSLRGGSRDAESLIGGCMTHMFLPPSRSSPSLPTLRPLPLGGTCTIDQ